MPDRKGRPASSGRPRDRRIDVLRGIALAMIFINHVPGTMFEHYTSRNFGFSDAAEGFVLISGTSAALAYSAGLSRRPLWDGVSRVWGRAWTLYLVHLMIMAWVIGLAAGMERLAGISSMMDKNNLQQLGTDMTGVLFGIPLMTHQLGYVNILPLYSVLLLAGPALIIAAMRWPRMTLGASVIVWALAGTFRLNLPNFPTKGGWFFDPLAWQLLFVLGILTGVALKHGHRWVPRRAWIFWPAAGYLVLSLVWLKWPAMMAAGNAALGKLATLGVPFWIRDFDKTFVALPRLLHVLSLAYVLSCLDIVKRLANSRVLAPVALLGRQALPVFALGTILSTVAQAFKAALPESALLDVGLIGAGLALQLALAWARDMHRKRHRGGYDG